jgi:hypothetical protein
LFVTATGGIFRSVDLGATWAESDSGVTVKAGLSLAALGSGLGAGFSLFAGSSGGGIFRSTDNGRHWSHSGSNLGGAIVRALLPVPATGGPGSGVFAATDKGVYLSTDNGQSWIEEDDGLEANNAESLGRLGTDLYVGTLGAGVWRRPMAEMITSVETSTSSVAGLFTLQQNYPNPFNPTTVISGHWTADSQVRLVVYNVLGRQVAVLANGRFSPGRYSFTFDGTNFASGVYFYRLTAGSFTAVRKMVLVR